MKLKEYLVGINMHQVMTQQNGLYCYYHPQRSWGKVMFLQVCVILFTGGGGEYLTPPRARYTSWTRYTPWDQVHPPPRPGTPPSQARYTPLGPDIPPGTRYPPPGTRYTPPHSMLRDTVNTRAVGILLECNLVYPVIYQSKQQRSQVLNLMLQ